VTEGTTHRRGQDELVHSFPCIVSDKIPKGQLRIPAARLAAGDLGGSTKGYIRWDCQEFAEEEVGVEH